MRAIRLAVWFCVGLLLGGVAVGASAAESGRRVEAWGAYTGCNYGQGCTVETALANILVNRKWDEARNGWFDGTTTGKYIFDVRIGQYWYTNMGAFDFARHELITCQPGQNFNELNNTCEAAPCEAGQTGSTSIQVGWSNYWDTNAKPYGVTSPSAGCSGECKVNVTGLAEQSCYLGDSGSGAPYQVLCWYKTETTGEQCTSGEGQLSDRRDPIPCPAGTTQGTIGDKTACLPSTTTETETTTNPDGSKTETTTKTNPDGSTEVTTTEKDASGNVISSTTKNYPAPGSPGSGSSGGEPGEGGEPQGTDDPLKECVENPDACKEGGGDFGAGAPDGAELFVRDEAKTFAAVLTKFRQDMGQTAFGQAAAGYFDVSGGGSCPVWSSTIPFIDTTITIDYFCDPAVADMLAVMKGALLVVFGFVAFRFAVL